jgi:hypothetical protein
MIPTSRLATNRQLLVLLRVFKFMASLERYKKHILNLAHLETNQMKMDMETPLNLALLIKWLTLMNPCSIATSIA